MNKIKKVSTPLSEDVIKSLVAGDIVELSGIIYTGRDAAHKRLIASLDNNEELPVNLAGQVIYFVGPCPAKPNTPIGSAGPTTSGRMDAYSPRLIRECKLAGMIGKGDRNSNVVEAMKECNALYFAATGGAGALIAKSIKNAEIIAYEDLGAEAIYKLEVEDFRVVVAIDSNGKSLYK